MTESEASPQPGEGRAARVRRVRESDRDAVRALRLEALRTDRNAFGSTYQRESGFDNAVWANRVKRGAHAPDEGLWVAETPDGTLAGMIGVYPNGEALHVVSMWVAPKVRRLGVGGRLLDHLLRWAAARYPGRRVQLDVNPAQSEAVRLYRSRGFVPTGKVEPLEHTPTILLEEMVWDPSSRSVDPGSRRSPEGGTAGPDR